MLGYLCKDASNSAVLPGASLVHLSSTPLVICCIEGLHYPVQLGDYFIGHCKDLVTIYIVKTHMLHAIGLEYLPT